MCYMALAPPIDPHGSRGHQGDGSLMAVASALTAVKPSGLATAADGAILAVDNITKRFETPEGAVIAVDGVSLSVAPGEFVGIIGPSGCGKSTLFNIIGGLLDGYEGTVKVAGDLVRGPHPAIGMIFQEESTFPWRTVIDNVAFPLEIAGMARRERYERASVLITTNLPFSEWNQVFQGERMTAALLDRLTHRCHRHVFGGSSQSRLILHRTQHRRYDGRHRSRGGRNQRVGVLHPDGRQLEPGDDYAGFGIAERSGRRHQFRIGRRPRHCGQCRPTRCGRLPAFADCQQPGSVCDSIDRR